MVYLKQYYKQPKDVAIDSYHYLDLAVKDMRRFLFTNEEQWYFLRF